jgi:hypothetical protein
MWPVWYWSCVSQIYVEGFLNRLIYCGLLFPLEKQHVNEEELEVGARGA